MWLMGAKANAVGEVSRALRGAIMSIRNDFSDEQESEIAADIAAEQEDNQSFEETSVDLDREIDKGNALADAIMAEQE